MLTAKIFLRLFLVLYLAIAALLLITYFTTPFYGDLSRIGLLPESMFGWRQPQASIPTSRLKSVKAADADVVVIGDSFSANLVWQSELVNAGLAVKTLHWTDFGSSLCDNVERWLNDSGFNNKGVIIIESIQRLFEQRLDASLHCRKAKLPYAADEAWAAPPPPIMPLLGSGARNGSEKLATGIVQLWNAHLVKTANGAKQFSTLDGDNAVVVRTVARGCDWFSHAFCTSALFIASEERAPLDSATIQKIKKINATLANYQVIWLIVPDKSTIYFEKDAAFWKQLASLSLGPNLYEPFLLERDTTRDFYLPNDTHLSTAGFLSLGKTASAYLTTQHAANP